MVEIWLLLGIIGWAGLMITRRLIDGYFPKGLDFLSYIKGSVLSLVLGPLCFIFLIYVVVDHLYVRSRRG